MKPTIMICIEARTDENMRAAGFHFVFEVFGLRAAAKSMEKIHKTNCETRLTWGDDTVGAVKIWAKREGN